MGTIHHNAVVASSWEEREVERLNKWIKSLKQEDQHMFSISPRMVNAYQTIIMFPDGSKEGWSTSDYFDDLRKDFIREIEKSGWWNWVEVGYGELGVTIKSNLEEENDY